MLVHHAIKKARPGIYGAGIGEKRLEFELVLKLADREQGIGA
jgi:hypothetical protein